MLTAKPITATDWITADHEYSGPTLGVPVAAPHADLQGLDVWTCWLAVAAAYSAHSGQVTLCRWRLVLRPGVLLTQNGIQLRPIIARLGQDVEAHRMLWNEKEQFRAAVG